MRKRPSKLPSAPVKRKNMQPVDAMTEAIANCSSGDIFYESSTAFKVKIAHVVVGESEWRVVDLYDYWLPATKLKPAIRLSEDRTLAICTVLAVDKFLRGLRSEKSKHRVAVHMVHTLAKLWEWGRLKICINQAIGTHFILKN